VVGNREFWLSDLALARRPDGGESYPEQIGKGLVNESESPPQTNLAAATAAVASFAI
jgi:hypothetical protein